MFLILLLSKIQQDNLKFSVKPKMILAARFGMEELLGPLIQDIRYFSNEKACKELEKSRI